ncbi:MAG: PSD1 domain-containing protein [Planctomycetia bacterium]|nr:PSD1 domain-containing protein [Planctomycetia bacterium]
MPLIAALVLAVASSAASSSRADSPRDEGAEFFELKIRPVLAGKCFKCHGADKASGGLRIDSRDALLKGGEHGASIVPGKPGDSLLVRALRHEDDEVQMPPDGQLAKQSIDDFAIWIEHGALWPASAAATDAFAAGRHWAFQPLGDPQTPAEPPDAGAIDRFIAAKRLEQGLSPVGPAERGPLLRRAYFDLVGLPPEPEELDRFADDDAPDAFARVVERLLASPQYGARWGRHWLDVVRYADTAGDNADYPVPEARFYRDYVIDSFNADKPYDQFVREQLAGDLLAAEHAGDRERYRDEVVATGFLALSRRYATAPYELWHLSLEDAIDTTGRAFLGLSLRCARCHDHKYDPVAQTDYYALYGIFNSTQFPWAGGEEFQSKKSPREHFVPLVPAAEAEPKIAAMRAAIEQLTAQRETAETTDDWQQVGDLRRELDRWQQAHKLDSPPGVPVAYAVSEGKPGDACVQLRGEPDKPGPVVPRGVPKFFAASGPTVIPEGASGRRQLAEWLTRPDHPLVARVMANRVWQWHFGRGLVATPSNLGLRGSPPTHPELLDWLARRLIDSGWSIKALHREIMLSRTYQLASTARAENAAHDPDNNYYWRFDRRRLDAEAIRDAMLVAGGTLDLARPGEHPFPPVKKWTWTQHQPFKASYPSPHRSVYLMTQRLQRHPYLALFDGPDTNTSTDVRTSATVPSQALFLLNNPLVAEQAEGLARRAIAASGDARKRVELPCLLCWSRRPTNDETNRAVEYVARVADELKAAGAAADRIELESWSSYARLLLESNEFVYVD